MWFFMISIYILSLISFVMLFFMLILSTGVKLSYLPIPSLTWVILTSIVYFFTETLVIFFFVGTGVSVRDYSQANKLSDEFRKTSLAIKHHLYPPTMLNLLLMIILFVLPGAVYTGKLNWIYFQYYFWICLTHYVYTKRIQHRCLIDNTNNILKMAGITRATV